MLNAAQGSIWYHLYNVFVLFAGCRRGCRAGRGGFQPQVPAHRGAGQERSSGRPPPQTTQQAGHQCELVPWSWTEGPLSHTDYLSLIWVLTQCPWQTFSLMSDTAIVLVLSFHSHLTDVR